MKKVNEIWKWGFYNFKWIRESLTEQVMFDQAFKDVEQVNHEVILRKAYQPELQEQML